MKAFDWASGNKISGVFTWTIILAHFGFLIWAEISHAGNSRQKVIDFEDDVVEGLNKRPLDSLSQISESERRKRKPHLYKKRVGFRTETQTLLRDLRY